jgi:hypothetical protein
MYDTLPNITMAIGFDPLFNQAGVSSMRTFKSATSHLFSSDVAA